MGRTGRKNMILTLRSFSFILALGAAMPAFAAPFTCSGEIYQVQSGQLRVFSPITSSYVNVGAAQTAYNATGFNTIDNYAYGSQGNNVIRIHSDGTVEVLYNVGFNSFAGDVDDTNGLYLRRSATQYSRVNLSTGVVTTVNITGTTVSGADIVFVRNGGVPYLVVVTTTTLGIINLNTNISTTKAIAGLPSGGFGATWTDFNGRVFAFNNNTGQIFELFNIFGATPTASLAGQGDPSSSNDGFSCPNAPFPNLPPVAQDDTFTTTFETAITRNLLIDNGSGADLDPESGALTVQTSPVSGPSNGAVTLDAAGNMTYTPIAGFYGTDSFVYRITDITGLTDTATVTITVPAPPIDLVTRKSLASGTSNPGVGDTVTFRIEVTNNGPAAATGVTLTDLLPSGLTPTANNGTVSSGAYSATTGIWSLGTIASGATESLILEGTVLASQAGQPLTNTTTKATGAQTDPTDSGNDLGESLVIFPLTLVANDDNSLDIVSSVGSANALNVFDGDTLQGVAATPSTSSVSVASGSSLPAGITFNTATGVVGVTPGTDPGTYAFDYQICEIANPANCDTANATVTVIATPIDAKNDDVSGIIGASGGTAVLNAFSSDTLNGAAATNANTTLALASGSSVPSGLVFNTASGTVDVVAGTPAGYYSFDYQLCEATNPSNCDIATITVGVIAASITASPDAPAPLTGATGNSNIGNAFSNDTLNGTTVNAADIIANVTVPATPVNAGAAVPALDTSTGTISVPANTPAGTYTIGYRVCEEINPTNCAVSTITVIVTPSGDLSIAKTNGSTVVYSGSTITYTLTVSHNGGDSITGAVVTDTPGAGITCDGARPVTITGDGVPAGSFTFADLTTGGGIALGTLISGQTTTLTYSCQVN